MSAKRLIVIGASSGGPDALRTLISALPADLAAAVCVVLHVSPDSPGVLTDWLARDATVTVETARTGARLEHGRVFIAPPDSHLLIEPGIVCLSKGPKENRSRPAIDPLFRSAAQIFGPAAVGVVLTGDLDDGAAGLATIKQLGGIAVVQNPHDALYPSMPRSALAATVADHVVALDAMPALLTRLVSEPPDQQTVAVPDELSIETSIAKGANAMDAGVERLGEPSIFACPECHGVLLKVGGNSLLRFRCHTGHAYSPQTLAAAFQEEIEKALWSAVRSLEEATLLSEQVVREFTSGSEASLQQVRVRILAAKQCAEQIRQIALNPPRADQVK